MLPLTCMAYKDSEIDDFGILTCVDMRKYLTSKKVNRLVGQTFAELFLTIGHANPKMTVRQVCKMFREKFNQMRNDDTLYGALYNINFDFPSLKNRFWAEISNIGSFEVKKPIVNVFIQQSLNSIQSEWYIGFTSFSRNAHDKNTISLRLERPQTASNHFDGEIIIKSFVHSMTKIPPDVSIIAAYDEIRASQNKIRHHK